MEQHEYVLTSDGEMHRIQSNQYHTTDIELKHWKYTRRELVNGKWRYWYEDENDESVEPSERPIGQNYSTPEDIARKKQQEQTAQESRRLAESKRLATVAKRDATVKSIERTITVAKRWLSQNYNQKVSDIEYKTWADAERWVDQRYPRLSR